MSLLQLTGRTFGRLTVVDRAPSTCKCSAWLCRCECGRHITALSRGLSRGATTSCGCAAQKQSRRYA